MIQKLTMKIISVSILPAVIIVLLAITKHPYVFLHSKDRTSPTPRFIGLKQRLVDLKMINYYPPYHESYYMWTQWDPREIDNDLAHIERMHANAVRIGGFMNEVGFPTPNSSFLNELDQFLNMAQRHHLRVKLSLFGFSNEYSNIDGSKRWLDLALKKYKNDPRIAYVDLHNEIDPYNPKAITWARVMLPYTKKILGDTPVTLSLKGGDSFGDGFKKLLSYNLPVDFYELHYYNNPSKAFSSFEKVKKLAYPKLVFIGETGTSTGPASYLDLIKLDKKQNHWYQVVENAVRRAGLGFASPWVYGDFAKDAIPSNVDIAKKPDQYFEGLVRLNGSEKPAAKTITKLFSDPSSM